MDWSKGYSARYYLSIVDRDTWRDVRRIEITGGSISRTETGLRESAEINCVNYSEEQEQLIRVWLDVRQESSSSHIPLFTGLATSPGKDINGKLITNTLQCYSVLKIAEDILLPRGWYAPANTDGSFLIEKLLKTIKAPIDISPVESPVLKYAIIAEDNENVLSMVDKILEAIDWRLILNGNGDIYIGPKAVKIDPDNQNETVIEGPKANFDSVYNDIIEPQLRLDYDWYSCPNVFRVVSGSSSAEARDDDPNSPFSTVNRKREVWVSESTSYLNEGETIAQYALRRLKECQRIYTTISYTRRFNPDLNVTDVVNLNYPRQEISGNFLIMSQTISLGHGATVSEDVKEVISL